MRLAISRTFGDIACPPGLATTVNALSDFKRDGHHTKNAAAYFSALQHTHKVNSIFLPVL